MGEHRCEVESWRCSQGLGDLPLLSEIHDTLVARALQDLLRQSSHGGSNSRCSPMKRARVTRVMRINNPLLWKSYVQTKDRLKQQHMELNVAPAALTPPSPLIAKSLPWIQLDSNLGEHLLFHGTRNVI